MKEREREKEKNISKPYDNKSITFIPSRYPIPSVGNPADWLRL